jgi:uncharacterized protein HemY
MRSSQEVRAFIPYEIALGDGEFARLVLPQDLTQAEAERLCEVIRSLAFGDNDEGGDT